MYIGRSSFNAEMNRGDLDILLTYGFNEANIRKANEVDYNSSENNTSWEKGGRGSSQNSNSLYVMLFHNSSKRIPATRTLGVGMASEGLCKV